MATVPAIVLPDTPPPGSDRVRQVNWWTRRCKAALAALRQAVVDVYVEQTKAVVLCAAYSPLATGPDNVQVPVPKAADGTVLTWNVKRATLRAATLGTQTVMTIEKSTGTGAFSGTTVCTLTLPNSTYEVTATSSSTVASGDKLRFNVTTLGTAAVFTLTVELATQ